ncbi:MAG: type II toxin-antitoxin system VapC family toxin [Chloroflexi bacterium]|nr:type II toxin-antitoxin system VapC family toxin [Chloroflexota bacterium]
MSFLLDTNVVSEWTRPQPDRGVVEWLASIDEDRTFLSVVTLAELRFGIERLAAGRRRASLQAWLDQDLAARFTGRVLGVDETVAQAWGSILARALADGHTISSLDGFIAATAQTADLTLVTRNVRDFLGAGVTVYNPWTP